MLFMMPSVSLGFSYRVSDTKYIIPLRSIELNGELANHGRFEFKLVLKLELHEDNKDTLIKFWGSYYDSSHTVIDTMGLTISSEHFTIPRQAILDLTQIDIGAGIRVGEGEGEEQGKVYVYLYSMQGISEPYDATFIFENKRLVRRIIEYSESSGKGGVEIDEF
jgi:hypothetical protein